MPNTGKKAEPPTEEEKARIVTGPDPDRFYCPHPGCNRSFAELWRLKVHFRAPPDVRGSGKERGHGTELKFCPKCGKDLRPGKHHVGCSAGKSAPRQAAKRQRQQQMSTTTESAQGLTAATTTEHTSGSWEAAVRRQAIKQRVASEAESTQRSRKGAEGCRIETLVHSLDANHVGGPELLFQPTTAALAGGPPLALGGSEATMAPAHFFGGAPPRGGHPPAPPAPAAQQQQPQQQHGAPPRAHPAQLPHFELPQHGDGGGRSLSPSPLDLFGDPFAGASGGGGGGAPHTFLPHDDDDLRIPSPPPLPADWDVGPRSGMLFDFDQFDASRRQHTGTSAPLVTVTTAMNPVDVLNPSDDYIWQILFAGENDAVPKRVTAHLHHPPANGLSYLDEADPLLDAILSDDLGPLDGHHQPQQQAQSPQQQGGQAAQQRGRMDPSHERLVPAGANGHAQQGQQHMLPSLDAVFHGGAGGSGQQRNGYGNGHPGHHGDLQPPALKLQEGSFV